MVAKLELANLSYPMMSCSRAKSCVQVTIPDILEQIFYISVPKHNKHTKFYWNLLTQVVKIAKLSKLFNGYHNINNNVLHIRKIFTFSNIARCDVLQYEKSCINA